MNNALPSLFISHGSPMTALEPGAAGAFFERLGPAIERTFGRPRAIVALSAHSLTREPVLLGAARHEAVHDFGGFDDRLYQMRYDAEGAPALAQTVRGLLQAAQLPAHVVPEGGLDHGIWTVLKWIFPQADIPVLPVAWVPSWAPAKQFALGQALAPLRAQGVLVMGSGSITHNLRRVFADGLRGPVEKPELPECAAFRTWMLERSAARDWPALMAYRTQAPFAVDMHPTDEHLLPWHLAAGAGGTEHAPRRLHDSLTYGCLGMDAYAFGEPAAALEAALA
jgi:4,5-DOPA dioxygenase extradiol